MSEQKYYLPEPSHWPLVGSIGLFVSTFGFASALNADGTVGNLTMMYIGLAIIAFMMFGWFGTVIRESEGGTYNAQVDTSFRMAMMWFIFSEVMFFAAFFGALFYVRQFVGPWLAGAGDHGSFTNPVLWDGFAFEWGGATPQQAIGGVGAQAQVGYVANTGTFLGPEKLMAWNGIPLLNTILLVASSVTVHFAHHALKVGKRQAFHIWLFMTLVLGFVFVGFQAYEYYEAYTHYGLTLESGIYGSTFFMLTGFHGFHVCMGAVMLTVMFLRSILRGHFTPNDHFGFEAASWYWHFVDVVWIGLFLFVYIL